MTEAMLGPITSADFSYGGAAAPDYTSDPAALRLTVSVIADRAWLREELREDAGGVGLRVVETRGLEALGEDEPVPRGDILLVDCPAVTAADLAGLARLDLHAARTGALLVVATSVDALDGVFGVLDQSEPQILVAPSRAERVIALGHALARVPGRKVRELSEEDRMVLIRLTNQVSQIAERMDKLNPGAAGTTQLHGENPAFKFDTPRKALPAAAVIEARPELPDPRLVRRIIRQRQQRARFFDSELFADPAWDMLLDLTAAAGEKAQISVTSLCIASGVPPTTALRWIGQMTQGGWLRRIEDKHDRRRAFVTLTDRAAEAMSRYFADLGLAAEQTI